MNQHLIKFQADWNQATRENVALCRSVVNAVELKLLHPITIAIVQTVAIWGLWLLFNLVHLP